MFRPSNLTDPDASYTNEDPDTDVAGSAVPAEAIENPMRELVALIAGAGLEPSGEDLTQVKQAIASMIAAAIGGIGIPNASEAAAGIIRLATAAAVLSGVGGGAVTPETLSSGFPGSINNSGYQRLPSGLIIQWGWANGNASNGQAAVTFPHRVPVRIFQRLRADQQQHATGVLLHVQRLLYEPDRRGSQRDGIGRQLYRPGYLLAGDRLLRREHHVAFFCLHLGLLRHGHPPARPDPHRRGGDLAGRPCRAYGSPGSG